MNLKNLGNTLIVVEHDEDTMRAADYIVDIGPAAGVHGGEVVAAGTAADIMKCKKSITGRLSERPDEDSGTIKTAQTDRISYHQRSAGK